MPATIDRLAHAVGALLLALIGATQFQADPGVPQLESRLTTASGAERLELLQQLTLAKLGNRPRAAIEHAEEALRLAEQLEDGPGRMRALSSLGNAHYFLGEYDRALEYYEACLAWSERLQDDEACANTLNDIGVVYYAWGEHDRTLEYYSRALEIWRRIDNTIGLAIGHNNLANVYHTAELYEEALEHLDQALALYEELGRETRVASVLNNIALSQQEIGLLDEALESLERALEIQQRLGDRAGLAMSLNNLGMAYGAQGLHREALEYYRRSLAVREEIGDRPGVATCISNIGASHAELDELDLALSHLDDALAMVQEMNVKEIERDIHLQLSQVYEKTGDHANALESYQRYVAIDDELGDERTARLLAGLESRFQLEQKDREIEVLLKEQQLQRTVRNAIVGGAALLAVLMLLLYNRYRLKDRANRALQEAQAAREERVRAEMTHVSMGELGTALAHELNQPLTAILANAQATRRLLASGRSDPAELDEALADIVAGSGRAREIIQRQRDLLQRGELAREALDVNAAIRAVESIARAEVRGDGATLSMRLVRTSLEDGEVRVAVSDTGPPLGDEVVERIFDPFFSTKPDGLGMGLSICHTIIEAHGGRLWATRRPARGLTVQFTLPGGRRDDSA